MVVVPADARFHCAGGSGLARAGYNLFPFAGCRSERAQRRRRRRRGPFPPLGRLCFFFFLVVLLPGGGGSSVGGCSLAEPIGNSRANLLGPKSVQTGQALRLVTRSGRVFRTLVVVRVGESGLCVAASELCVFKLKRGSE